MRTLTGPADSEKDKQSTTPVNVLKIEFGGAIGTKYYSDRDISSPITAEGRVISWGEFSAEAIEAEGTISDIQIELEDSDLVLLGYIRTQNLLNVQTYFYQFFTGLVWGDSVLLLRGVVKDVSWEESTPKLSLSIENIQALFNKTLGTEATKEIFPNIRKEDEGKILPLAFGKIEKGQAVQVIDSKRTTLVIPLPPDASVAIVTDSRDFGQGITNIYNILIGRELVRGYFDGSKLQILQRELVITTGLTTFDPPNGRTFRANLTPAGPSWVGYRIRFYFGSTEVDRQISNYTSPDVYGIDAWLHVPAGVYYEIYGKQEKHDAGEIVQEKIENYTWIVNDAPSDSFDWIEIEASLQITGQGVSNKVKNITTIVKLREEYYTINLNDSTWAGLLGHNVTSIVLPFDPKNLPNSPYASGELLPTFVGITDTNPVDIIVNLAERLGLTYPGDFDTASETAAQTATSWLNFGFQITSNFGYKDLYDIAFQARLALNFDQGVLTFKYLENAVGSSILTVTDDERVLDSLEIQPVETHKVINKVTASFYDRGIIRKITATDTGSIAKYGEQEKELNLWCINIRAFAESIAQFWLRRWSESYEICQFKTPLTSLEVERYDWITLNFTELQANQPAEVLKVSHAAGAGEGERLDLIELETKIPKFAGCASSCEAYEQTACASTCEQVCQSIAETSCNYTCETSAQDACSLTCVTICELECTSYYQMIGGGTSCATGCETGCTNQCQTGCTTAGCQGGCTASCTAGCQGSGCTASCQAGCETGGCQVICELAAQTTACTDSCEVGQQSQPTTCATSCQVSCTTTCTTTCQVGCTTGSQGDTSCNLCCESVCMVSCEEFCMVTGCQSGCTNQIEQEGGFASCLQNCETKCQGKCEGGCQDCCQYDGTETTYFCSTYCQTASCMQNCQAVAQGAGGDPGVCGTSCQATCMLSATTGCGDYCTVGCECFCQATCQAACMTGSCQTDCQCDCQTASQGTPCSSTNEGTCYSVCQQYDQTGCTTMCQTGCQGYCQTECMEGCEVFCTTGCQCDCQAICEFNCTSGCESICECLCQTSVQVECGLGCRAAGGMTAGCETTCTAAQCTTTCTAWCQTACTTAACQTGCQGFCMTGGCTAGCEFYCTVGCQCDCQAICEAACRSGGCEEYCQCECQTAAQ